MSWRFGSLAQSIFEFFDTFLESWKFYPTFWYVTKWTNKKDYPENSIPDRKHPHSLQKYFQSKRLIPDCKWLTVIASADPFFLTFHFSALEWNQLNTKQQDELILRDKKDRIKKADKKIVSILDELFDVSSC